jgi:DNA polymerase-3 subunit alpha
VVAAREQGGVFKSLFDFCQRLDLRKLNRRVLEAFIKSGAMDVWQVNRASLEGSLESAVQYAGKSQQNRESFGFQKILFLDFIF